MDPVVEIVADIARVLDPVDEVGHPWGYGWTGDGRESRLPGERREGDLRSAAVLVPVVVEEAGVTLLVTQRTMTVRDHKGQVSFPGGMREQDDESHLETALRETEEEVGVSRELVHVVGRLRPYDTITGFRVHPFVGIIKGRPGIVVNDDEIEEVFLVDLEKLMDPATFAESRVEWQGQEHVVRAYDWGGPVIWGATVNILSELIARVRQGSREPAGSLERARPRPLERTSDS